jgi:hypothetical protein
VQIRIWTIVALLVFVILSVSVLAAFYVETFLSRRLAFLASFSKYCVPALLVFCLVYVFHDLVIFYRGLAALTVMLGICIGMFLPREHGPSNPSRGWIETKRDGWRRRNVWRSDG